MLWSIFWTLVALFAASWFFGAVILELLAVIWAGGLVAAAVFFTFGTVPFWLLLLTVTAFVAWCVSDKDGDLDETNDTWSGAAVASVLLFGALVAITNYNVFSFEGYSTFWTCVLIVVSFAVYLGVGGAWSVFRYYRFGINRNDKITEWKRNALLNLKGSGLNSEQEIVEYINKGEPTLSSVRQANSSMLTTKAEEILYKDRNTFDLAVRFRSTWKHMNDAAKPENNWYRMALWIGLWPWSIIAWVLRDPVKFVYDLLLDIYKGIYVKTVGQSEVEYQTVFSNMVEK